MTDDLLDDLRRADPVDRDALAIPPAMAARALQTPPRRRTLARLVPVTGAAAVLAGVAIVLVATHGGSPDLAARAYAATTGRGIVHWRTDLVGYANGKVGSRQRIEGWRLGSTMRLLHFDVRHGKAHLTMESRTVGRHSKAYMAGADDWFTSTLPKHRVVTPFSDGDPFAIFRRAYRDHKLRDLGGGRFEVPFKHLAPGSVVYDVDASTGRPLRLTVTTDVPATAGRPAVRSQSVWTFSAYETLPDTPANHANLALRSDPGAGPSKEPAGDAFSVLRTGSAPAGKLGARLRQFAAEITHAHVDPDGIRRLRPNLFLMPGAGYVCLAKRETTGPRLVRGSIGASCQTVKVATRRGVSIGGPTSVTLVVPDGVRAVQAGQPGGHWRRFAVVDNVVKLPGPRYQWRFVRQLAQHH